VSLRSTEVSLCVDTIFTHTCERGYSLNNNNLSAENSSLKIYMLRPKNEKINKFGRSLPNLPTYYSISQNTFLEVYEARKFEAKLTNLSNTTTFRAPL
jgi:hypothetical protein